MQRRETLLDERRCACGESESLAAPTALVLVIISSSSSRGNLWSCHDRQNRTRSI